MLTFARICIDVDASKALPISIPIRTSQGKTNTIEVEYDWKPSICTTCKSFGYETQRCGTTTTLDPKSKPQTQGWNTTTNKGTRKVWTNNKDAGRQHNTTSRPEVNVTNSFAAIQNVDEQELTLQVNMPYVLETDQLAQSKEDVSSCCSRVVESQLPEEGEIANEVRIEDEVADAINRGTTKLSNTSKEDKDTGNATVTTTMCVVMSREPTDVDTSVPNKAALEASIIKARLSELEGNRQSMLEAKESNKSPTKEKKTQQKGIDKGISPPHTKARKGAKKRW
ncbi:hypothetical protein FRX31_024067 [Thalictrum thalictroides]|uniref:Zinc knuckle CX2CX4HX4C domain-containing protein n=1 Tax=Thalictrum thalictroides TaxID=46969 RepID=A0A7J6VQ61_THATH|nr:hypothetical protein FRX31_024067 [Thalictrum thalictroides]